MKKKHNHFSVYSRRKDQISIQQLDKCMTTLLDQTLILRKIIDNLIKKSTSLINIKYSDKSNDIPERLLHHRVIKEKTRNLICKEAINTDLDSTAEKYGISSDLIEKWLLNNNNCDNNKNNNNNKSSHHNNKHSHHHDQELFKNTNLKRISPELIPTEVIERNKESRKKHAIKKLSNLKGTITNLSVEEKGRIVYDYLHLGCDRCTRKWGTHHSTIMKIINSNILFNRNDDRDHWIKTQRSNIFEHINNLNGEKVRNNIQNCIVQNKTPGDDITIEKLSNYSFDRGLAVTASKYQINIFDLEYFLKTKHKQEFEEMERNDWYMRGEYGEHEPQPTKLEMLKLVREDGYGYASKRLRKTIAVIRKRILNGEGGYIETSRSSLSFVKEEGEEDIGSLSNGTLDENYAFDTSDVYGSI